MTTIDAEQDTSSDECTPGTGLPNSTADELWQQIHADLVEWMTEGTHPYRIPNSDHG